MKKRRETDAVRACLEYLQCLENLKIIPHFDRLNAGSPKLASGKQFRGVRKGTSDIVIYLWSGLVLWVEVKTDERAKQRDNGMEDSQIEFKEKICKIENHRYEIVTDTDQVMRMLKRYKVQA
jgi:hypothetical protein